MGIYMAESKEILTLEKFHEALHKDINKPIKNFREEWNQAHHRHIKVHTGAHRAAWAKAIVLLGEKKEDATLFTNRAKDLIITSYRHYLRIIKT